MPWSQAGKELTMVDFALTPRQEELREIARRFAVEVMIPAAETSGRVWQ